nr:endolytic transglycosylase MltG [Streptococcus sp. zg-70]
MDEDSHSLVTRFPSEEDAVEATSHILSDFPSDTDNLAFQESEAVEPRNILSESAEVELDRPKLEASSDELEDLTATVALPRNSVREVIREIESSPISRAELEDTIIPTVPRKQVESRTMQTRRRHHQRKKQDGLAKRIVKVVVVTVLLLLLLTGVTGYFYLKSSLEPVNAQATEITQIEIPEGSSTKEIAKILEENRLIKNATVFTYYSKLKSFNNFQSGFYNLSQSMTVEELAKALQESGTPTAQEPIAGKVLVVEGYTIKQIAQAVTDNVHTSDKEDKTPFTAEAFLETVQNEAFINRMVATYPKLLSNLPAANSGVKYRLEGYLFPATYEYSTKTTIEELVEQMVAAMDSRLQPYYDQLAAKGLDVNQLLTVASLVEKEGSTDEDRRNIAGVFFNRLNAGMPLQSNIAILYAMDKLGEKTTLKEDATIDTNIDSPYNIYVNAGLMPGPVDSPSLSAIEASFAPNKTNYYFFVADVTTGSVYFAETGEEHNQNVEKYINSKLNN